MANLIEWAKSVAGRYIDVDDWAGAQCWDLSQAWLTACNGGVLWTQPSNYPGLAAGSWEVATQNTANSDDLLRHVIAIAGTERGLPGDLIIWAYGSVDYPISHTAVLIEDRGPILHTLSQNSSPARPDLPGYSVESSGPTIYQDLTRAGILGFLRPRATITGQGSTITPITSEEEELMSAKDEIMARLDEIVGWEDAHFALLRGQAERNRNMLAGFVRDTVASGQTLTVAQLDTKLKELEAATSKTQLVKGDKGPDVYVWDGATGYRHIDLAEFQALASTGATLKTIPQDKLDAAVTQ